MSETETETQGKNYFPRTFTKGAFKGQTFQTRGEYAAALKQTRLSGERQKRKANKPKPNSQLNVRKVVDMYEEVRQEGIGPAKAARLIEVLFEGR